MARRLPLPTNGPRARAPSPSRGGPALPPRRPPSPPFPALPPGRPTGPRWTEKYPTGYYRADPPVPSATRAKRPVPSHARDPQRTQDRILAAALAEFSAEGFAGARVARIARRAGVNKRMLYHYFGNKEDLFPGIFDRKLVQRAPRLTAAPPDLGASLAYWFEMACEDSDWIRLGQWEALGMADPPVIPVADRPAPLAR